MADTFLKAQKVRDVFGELSVDKRRLPSSGLTHLGVPAYVGEWVLEQLVPGEGALSEPELTVIHEFITEMLPKKNEGGIYKHRLLSREIVQLLTYLSVEIDINRVKRTRDAKIPALGLKDCWIADELVDRYQDLLKHGMWGIVHLGLAPNNQGVRVMDFEPMQASVNLPLYYEKRHQFSNDEWRELMLISTGYNPAAYRVTEQLWILCRLLPLVQKRMHLMELAPKGTGKSYLYEQMSPRIRLVSGNVTPAVLFVNNQTGQEGLLARFDVVVLDEVQKLKFSQPEEVIASLKGYLANGRITRGGKIEIPSDCGFVILANIPLDENQQPLSDLLVENLPEFMRETAFLDRFRGILPGWQIPKFRQEMIAVATGLKADFFSDTLTAMRHETRHEEWVRRHVQFSHDTSIRDQDAIISVASGLMKILYPDLNVEPVEFNNFCLQTAVEMRQHVRNQLWVLDAEYRQTEKQIRAEVMS